MVSHTLLMDKFCRCLFLGSLLLSLSAFGNTGILSLKKAMLAKIVLVKAAATRGHQGTDIRLELINNTDKELKVSIDPGLIFEPEDTTRQDIVTLGDDALALAPRESKAIDVIGFCGKSYAHGPISGMSYHFKKQGDSNMIKTLIYARNNNISLRLTQHAVWTFTNHHPVNSIFDHENVRMSEDFVMYVAKLKKTKLPDYQVEYAYNLSGTQPVVAYGNEKVYLTMHWGNDGYRNMYLSVYRPDGTKYKEITADQVIDKYGYTVMVQFDPRVDPKGGYLVKLHDNSGKIWDQKTVVIE